MQRKDILIFDIKGYAAHFKKFYTNSSSLTYSIPPRTTISGLIAGILGLQRDEYYHEFSGEKVDIAIKKNTRTRKILQSINYMKIRTSKDFFFPQDHTQVPFEMVLGQEGLLSYRIYFSCDNRERMDELERRIQTKKYYYAPYLGAAPFNCSIHYVERVKGKIEEPEGIVSISSAIPQSKIQREGIILSRIHVEKVMIIKERMAREFKGQREIKSVESYFFDENTNPLPVKIKSQYVKIHYQNREENILFM